MQTLCCRSAKAYKCEARGTVQQRLWFDNESKQNCQIVQRSGGSGDAVVQREKSREKLSSTPQTTVSGPLKNSKGLVSSLVSYGALKCSE